MEWCVWRKDLSDLTSAKYMWMISHLISDNVVRNDARAWGFTNHDGAQDDTHKDTTSNHDTSNETCTKAYLAMMICEMTHM